MEHNPIKSNLPNFAGLTLGAIERGEILATQPYHTTVIAQVLDDAKAREYLNIGGLVGPCATDIASSDSCSRGIYARSELSTPTKSTTRSCSTSSTKGPIVSQRTSSYSPGTTIQSPAQPPHGTSSTTRQTCTAGPLQVMIYVPLPGQRQASCPSRTLPMFHLTRLLVIVRYIETIAAYGSFLSVTYNVCCCPN